MADTVLVPLDGSDKAYDALDYAVTEHPGATITVLHALDLGDASMADGAVIVMDEGIREAAENRAENIFEEARDRAAEAGHDGNIETITEEGKPGNAIVKHADESDVVVMGSYGRKGVGQKLLGSVAEKVVRRSSVPVTVVK